MTNKLITGKNGAILGATIGTIYGLYYFKPDYGRIVGLAFLSTIVVAWGFAAYENEKNKPA